MTSNKARWHHRFDNYQRAYYLLQEACERHQQEPLEQLAQEGMIQRFEFCMELAWKTMKDYMEHNGVVFAPVFPTAVIKEAGATKLIDNPGLWLQALDDRNKMSHTYDFSNFEQVIERITTIYIDQCFGALHATLVQVIVDAG